jgi:hypothetical protein
LFQVTGFKLKRRSGLGTPAPAGVLVWRQEAPPVGPAIQFAPPGPKQVRPNRLGLRTSARHDVFFVGQCKEKLLPQIFCRDRALLRPAFALLAASAIALGAGAVHAADALYKYVDANGVTNFTNVPPNGRYKLLEKTARGGFVPVAAQAALRSFGEEDRTRYDSEIAAAAKVYNLDPALLHAVISVESGYDRFARSNKGAAGLMQLTMDTAIRYGVTNRYDVLQNLLGGARYLRDLLAMFHNDMKLALAAYNAGENAVVRYGNHVPPYRETIDYVPRVLSYYKQYRRTVS